MNWTVAVGDCLDRMAEMDAGSVDSIVTDPPYGLSFMGKDWDHGVPGEHFWAEALRVAKPGAHLLAFGGTRTFHRLACAIEDAGWEIRDTIMWVYSSGFPKSHSVGKAIDKAAGAEREVVGSKRLTGNACVSTKDKGGTYGVNVGVVPPQDVPVTAPATEDAKKWEGWGTALKPAWEPIIVARKRLDGTVAENVCRRGTGAINIDACRVGVELRPLMMRTKTVVAATSMSGRSTGATSSGEMTTNGRWPANLIHDGSDDVVGLFPRDAERFFYCAKTSKEDRGEGNGHPTVKPTDLMRYLCRLVTPPNGMVMDPFCGSGSTGKAALLEGFRFFGIELSEEYAAIATKRLGEARGLGI